MSPERAPQIATSPRFLALDGLRGVIALVVMVGHYSEHNRLGWLPGAWVSVDLFYVLSGFVIMHGYGARLASGMGLGSFVRARLQRLAPLYLIGLGLGIVAALRYVAAMPEPSIGLRDVATAATLNLFLLPDFNVREWPFGNDAIPGTAFPLNDPTWSLCFELIANLLFFAYVRSAGPRYLRYRFLVPLVCGCALGYLFVIARFNEFNPGWGTQNFVFALPRAAFGFFLGALICRLHGSLKAPSPTFVIAVVAALAFCFSSPFVKVVLVATFALSPLLIALLSKVEIASHLRKPLSSLGSLSYPLYATHFPVYRLMYEFTGIGSCKPLVQVLVIGLVAIALATALIRLDQYLRGLLPKRPAAPIKDALAS